MGALAALASAVSYGLSDVLGGLLSRRVSFVRVALLGQTGGLVSMAFVAPLFSTAVPSALDLAWGGLSGIGTGVAMMFLFRGISRGAMSVVVPISAVGGVALPILIGVLVLGERPALFAWAGIAVALPALWAVSQGLTGGGAAAKVAVADGLISGGGIALQYLMLAQTESEAGTWPIVAGRVTAITTIVVLNTMLRLGTTRRIRRDQHFGSIDVGAGCAGVLAGVALICYLLATRSALLTVAVVLSSLYPVIPVVLGITMLGEQLTTRQALGLAAALAATALIALA